MYESKSRTSFRPFNQIPKIDFDFQSFGAVGCHLSSASRHIVSFFVKQSLILCSKFTMNKLLIGRACWSQFTDSLRAPARGGTLCPSR